jgi:hypothetical protein
MSKNYYISGEHNLICDRCSKKIKAHESKQEWTGFIVCTPCWETRQPQDFVKAKTDKITVPFTRPRSVDVFTNVNYFIFYVDDGWVDDKYFETL